MRKIPFSPPDISEKEIAEVIDTLRSGWITTGPKTKKLEKEIAAYLGVNTFVCLANGTAAEELNLHILGVKEGDEVIVPAYTYTATASAAIHVGAKVRIVDCQKDRLEMDYDALSELINEHTKAIIPVDLGGTVCDYDRLFAIVESKKHLFKPESDVQKALGRVAIVSDSAHAFGSTYKGKFVGDVADFTSFSFHAVKNFTVAEGGGACFRHIEGIDDADLYKRYMLLSLHGQSKDALAKSQLGAWEYDVIAPLYKCNMTDISASLGLVQLERYPSLLSRRKEIIDQYDKLMNELDIPHLEHTSDTYTSCGHLYLTFARQLNHEKRCEVITKMAERGISCNVHYKPLPLLTAYKNLGFDIHDYPNAYHFYERCISLPLHTLLSDEDVAYVIDNFRSAIHEYR